MQELFLVSFRYRDCCGCFTMRLSGSYNAAIGRLYKP